MFLKQSLLRFLAKCRYFDLKFLDIEAKAKIKKSNVISTIKPRKKINPEFR